MQSSGDAFEGGVGTRDTGQDIYIYVYIYINTYLSCTRFGALLWVPLKSSQFSFIIFPDRDCQTEAGLGQQICAWMLEEFLEHRLSHPSLKTSAGALNRRCRKGKKNIQIGSSTGEKRRVKK